MALYEQSVGATDEWYTPPYIFAALACRFDQDVAPINGRGGLEASWSGFVWMNPPFGGRNGIVPWLEKFIAHGNGVCLVPDRTSAPWWQAWAPKMDLILFVSPKIKFISAAGTPGPAPAQGTCLGAMGEQGCAALRRAASLGIIMRLDTPRA